MSGNLPPFATVFVFTFGLSTQQNTTGNMYPIAYIKHTCHKEPDKCNGSVSQAARVGGDKEGNV